MYLRLLFFDLHKQNDFVKKIGLRKNSRFFFIFFLFFPTNLKKLFLLLLTNQVPIIINDGKYTWDYQTF